MSPEKQTNQEKFLSLNVKFRRKQVGDWIVSRNRKTYDVDLKLS